MSSKRLFVFLIYLMPFTLTGCSSGSSGGDDEDTPTQATLAAADVSISEGNGATTASIVVSLSQPVTSVVSVDYATSGDSATTGVDFETTSGRISLPAGSTRAVIEVAVFGDTLAEDDERFSLVLSGATGAGIADATALVTIVDDDPSPTLRVVEAVAAETGSVLTFRGTLSAPSALPIEFSYATQPITATPGVDYVATAATAILAPGETEVLIAISLLDDVTDEAVETLQLRLADPVNVSIATPLVAGAIEDDDVAPFVSASGGNLPEGDAGNSLLPFVITLSSASERTVTTTYATSDVTATAGEDYQTTTGVLVFDPGVTQQSVSVPIIGDTQEEAPETLLFTLSAPENAILDNAVATGTIEDDDSTSPPAAFVTISDVDVTEGLSADLTVTLSNTLAGDALIAYTTFSASATAGADFAAVTGELTIPAGQLDATLQIATLQDTLDETDELFIVALTAVAGTIAVSDGQADVIILDDDALPTLTMPDLRVDESAGSAQVLVSLSTASGRAVRFDYTSAADSASAGEDFTSVAGTATIAAGITTAIVEVPLLADTIPEGDERLTLRISNPVNASISRDAGTIVIQDDDALPALSIADASASEDTGLLTFDLLLDGPSGQTVSADFSISPDSASAGLDYQDTSGTINLIPGTLSAQITVSLETDLLDEIDETFLITLSNPANATLGDAQGQGTILDDDAAPELQIDDASGLESSGALATLVTLTAPSGRTVTVDYATNDGTASAPDDYTAAAGTLSFTPGALTAPVTITLTNDTLPETDETFVVTLNAPVNATIADAAATLTISNDDGLPAMSVSSVSSNEDATQASFDIVLSEPSGALVTAGYTTLAGSASPGADFTGTTGTVTLLPGQTNVTVDIPIVDDTLDEADETFTFLLSGATNANLTNASATALIIDNDPLPDLSVNTPGASEDAGLMIFTATLATPSGRTVTASYSTSDLTASAGSDYVPASGTFDIPAGTLEQTIAITVTDDALDELSETLMFTLFNPINATLNNPSAAGTITDDDPLPVLSIADAGVVEADSTTSATIGITLSAPTALPVSATYATSDGSAVDGDDYFSASGTLTLDPGETSTSVTVDIIGDTDAEPLENFVVDLTGASNATIGVARATVTISDDDGSVGLPARPSNTTCIAPDRPTDGATVQLIDAYPDLPFLNFPVKALQAPGDPTRWFVLEKSGRLRVFVNDPAVNTIDTYLDLAVDPDITMYTGSEGGLLGAAFHPDWPAVKELYLSYTVSAGGIKTRITRFIISNDTVLPATYTKQVLLTVDQDQGNHNGGEIGFGMDRLLYASLGDGGGSGDPNARGQDTTRLLGSMLRLDVLGVDYSTDVYLPRGDVFTGSKCGPGANPGNNCPEIYAWGLRNPWRWSFDLPSRKLWLGDVGQGLWEEVDIIAGGGNYGWRCREGAHDFNLSGCPASGLIDPVHEYPHQNGNVSITGGFVYRGADLPDLIGEYVFGDFNSGRIWTLEDDGAGGYQARQLVDSSINISAFAQAFDGELYAVRYADIGRLYRLGAAAPGGSDTIPDSLADTGCVDPLNPTQPASGLVQYAPAAPFWSDNAAKERYVALPDGAAITVLPDNDWDLPNGSVVLKNFRVGSDMVETRLLMRHPDGVWAGYTYEWNQAQTAATRVRGGKVRTLPSQDWIYPSEGECMSCHTQAANFALGLETAQLNSEITYTATGISDNQLEVFNHIDMFTVDVPEPVVTLPQLVDPADSGAQLEDRARAYLHTNCAQCHQAGGPTPVNMDLLYSTSLADANICNAPPEAGPLGTADLIVAPGDAGRSVLVQRMNRRDVYGMPPLGSGFPDSAGVALISSWIDSLTGCP